LGDEGNGKTGDRRQSKRFVDLALRVVIPVGFAVLTVFNVISLVHQGRGTPTNSTSGSPAQQVKLATVGEIGQSPSAWATLRALAAKHPDLYVGLGDLSGGGAGSESRWCSMARSEIGPVAPFEVVAGRAEEDRSNAGGLDALAACLPDRMSAVGSYAAQYYFDLGKLARVIAISPDLTINGTYYYYNKGSKEYDWLAGAIKSARTTGVQWVIVTMNDDCISAGQYYCDVNPALLSLLTAEHVDLVLSARDHSYQRSSQIGTRRPGCPVVTINSFNSRCVTVSPSTTRYRRQGGTVFVVVGSASSDLYPINEKASTARYLEKTMGQNKEPRRGGLLLTISASALAGRFVPSSPGTFADQFSIEAKKTRSGALK
jgi:hypothetical protein